MHPDLSAEFHLSSSSLPLVGLAAAIPDARIELNEILRTGIDRATFLCWIETDSFESVETAFDAEASIVAWSLLEAASDRRLYRLRMTTSAEIQVPIEEGFIEQGVTPHHATIKSDGWHVRARFPDRATIIEYHHSCQKRGMSFVLEQLYQPTAEHEIGRLTLAGLTPKQREALRLAYEEGYYDLPRKTNLTDLSKRIGISRRSLSDRLRRAERQLVETAITNERTQPR